MAGVISSQVGINFGEDGNLYLAVDLAAAGGPELEAIIGLDVSSLVPVELVSFNAVVDGREAVLSWETSSETNNAGFEVQVSDGGDFSSAGFVNGSGTTTEGQAYQYRVNDLDTGAYTFRLKQIDFDGAFEYSPEVEVEIGLPESHRLTTPYPNPFNPTTQFTLAVAESQDVTLGVYDVLGRRVALLHDGNLTGGTVHEFTLDAARMASGTYVIRAESETFVSTQRVTLLK